jgi:nucleoside-diphosphate-sugar epimerase
VVGCGYVGSRLAGRLIGRRSVLALLRAGPRADLLETHGVDVLRIDLDSVLAAGSLERAAGADIVYLAPPPGRGEDDPRLARFLSALDDGWRPSCVLYMSTTGVYGDRRGGRVDEATVPEPGNDRSRRRLAAERCVQAWCTERGSRPALLRVPGIYGPQRLPLQRLLRGEPLLRPEDAGPGNRIHVDDLVAACEAVLEGPVDGVVNVCDGDHRSTTEFMQELARQAGLPPPRLVGLDAARESISPGMLAFLAESRVVESRRMTGELGLGLLHPRFESGIRASLAEAGDGRAAEAAGQHRSGPG